MTGDTKPEQKPGQSSTAVLDNPKTNRPKVRHLYPGIASSRPRVGDKALCGWIKQVPTAFRSNAASRASGIPICVVCADLRRSDPRPDGP